MGVSLEDIVSLAKRRGFIFPSSEIYGGLAGVYDYGPLGTALKHNIQNLWWNSFVTSRDDMYPMDAAILMNKKVWEASGHATGFNDPMVECSNCHSRLRQDHVEGDKCPVCGKEGTLSEPKQFNMMFRTFIGPAERLPGHGTTDIKIVKDKQEESGITRQTQEERYLLEGDASVSYLRPETAQGMFVNFKNILDTVQPDMPFGLAQIGKAFRNEISPRDFLFRLREMEQMEIEYFVREDNWEATFELWRVGMTSFFKKIGLPEDKIHELEVPEEDRAHYSKRTIDFQFDFPFKTDELAGLAYRGDYDLKNHQEASGKDLQYRPKEGSSPFLPHVIEPSFGVERLVLALLSSAYSEDEQGGEKRVFLKLPADIAPVKVAVFPLLKNKPELVTKAKEVYKMLKDEIGTVMFDDNGNIGKRYRRQDEIGTPWCLTVDFDSLEDDTLTLRSRDTTQQERVKVNEISERLR